MSGVLDRGVAAILVTLLAFAQIVVHTIFFLHVNTKAEGGWILMAFVFTAVMIFIVISGSLCIEGHVLRAGDFHHAEGDSDHGEAWTDEGVELLLVASASDYAD